MNPIHIRANVTCAILSPLNLGKQLEPERLHMRPSYTKSPGDLFSLWGKEKETNQHECLRTSKELSFETGV